MYLYVTVQGRVETETADFTVRLEPGVDEGPLPGLNTWSGWVVLIILILMIFYCIGFSAFVFLFKREEMDRLLGRGERKPGAGRKKPSAKNRKHAESNIHDYDFSADDIAPVYEGGPDAHGRTSTSIIPMENMESPVGQQQAYAGGGGTFSSAHAGGSIAAAPDGYS